MKPYKTFVGTLAACCNAAHKTRALTDRAEFERMACGKWRVCVYR